MTGIIAVHVGAGCHSISLQDNYRKIMKRACREAISTLKNGGCALDAVCAATQILENSSLTNAGFGSSLTYEGNVECDACVMDGKRLHHGSVGAVSGVKNPVRLAREILEAQHSVLPGGLIPPSFLAGSGARTWAESHNIETCEANVLISEKSKEAHRDCYDYIKGLEERKDKRMKCNNENEQLNQDTEQEHLLDTVGAVCIDNDGNSASAVSSGGLLLKQSGRIGQAAVYGCGCWAENNLDGTGSNVAVSTSGCGEHLIRTNFAQLCAKSTVLTDPLGTSLAQNITSQFIESPFLRGIESKMAGSICLRYDASSSTSDLFWLHTTRTMGVGYMSLDNEHPQAVFTEVPQKRVGKTVSLSCKSFIGVDTSIPNEPHYQEQTSTSSLHK